MTGRLGVLGYLLKCKVKRFLATLRITDSRLYEVSLKFTKWILEELNHNKTRQSIDTLVEGL